VRVDRELTARCRLSHAARVGDADRVKTLIATDAAVRGDGGVRTLCDATAVGYVDAAAALLDAGGDPDGVAHRWDDEYPKSRETQPWSAVDSSATPSLVPLLLEAGGGRGVLQYAYGVDDALLTAAAHGHLAALWLLLPLHAAPDHMEDFDLIARKVHASRRLPALTLLLVADAMDPFVVLPYAADGWVDGVRLALTHGAQGGTSRGVRRLGSAVSRRHGSGQRCDRCDATRRGCGSGGA
jgi:hypothetical protein